MTEIETDDTSPVDDRLDERVAWVGYLYPDWEVTIAVNGDRVTWHARRREVPTPEQAMRGVLATVRRGSGLDLAVVLEQQAELLHTLRCL